MATPEGAREGSPEAAAPSAPGFADRPAGLLRPEARVMGAAWCPSGPGGRFPPRSCPATAPGEARRSGDGARSFLPPLEVALILASGRGTAPPAFLTSRRRCSCDLPPGAGGGLASPRRNREETVLEPPPPFHFVFLTLLAESKKEVSFPCPSIQRAASTVPCSPLSPRPVPGLGSPREKWRSPVGVQTLPGPLS